MKDYLVKALAYDGFVRAYAVSATETIAEAQRRHETWNTASAALGRAMVGSLLLGSTLKGRQIDRQNSRKWSCWGNRRRQQWPWGRKGYIKIRRSVPLNPQGKLDVRGAVGDQDLYRDQRLRAKRTLLWTNTDRLWGAGKTLLII